MRLARRFIPLLLLFFVVPLPARACNVPVFRYALERWRPDPYQAILFHRDPLAEKDKDLVQRFNRNEGEPGVPNLAFELVDVSHKDLGGFAKVWQAQKDPALPWLVVRYPGDEDRTVAWAGPLTEKTVRALTNSPARQELARRLLRGDTAVWVLLHGGHKEKDAEARKLLDVERLRLPRVLLVPEQLAQDTVPLLANLPVTVAFTALPVNRLDPAEKDFVALLLGTAPDLAQATDPIVFPVFGRGRILTSLTGKDLSAETLQDVGAFLCGACSCQVKQLNPGKDLLMAADWDSILQEKAPTEPEKTAGGELVPIPPGKMETISVRYEGPSATNSMVEPAKNWSRSQVLLIAAGGIVILVLGSGIFSLRNRSRKTGTNDQ